MRASFSSLCVASILALILTISAVAQSPPSQGRRGANQKENKTRPASPQPTPGEDQQDSETIKINTNLVTVPVIASDRSGNYIPDMRQDEFTIYEDGVQQQLVFFATVNAPFHVVLMLDTSGSTQEKLRDIQRAATAFVEQLQPGDRIKIISFDDEVRDLSSFTNDRYVLRRAINATRPGQGTKLYDAVQMGLDALQEIKGRKAIVLFTDGVDWHSDTMRSEDNLRTLDESGIIVYPIRYDTREETERIARQQQESGVGAIGSGGIIPGPGGGSGIPHLPEGVSIPGRVIRGPSTYPGRPSPPILTGPTGTDPIGRSGRYPDENFPNSPGGPTPRSREGREDLISGMLDRAYREADAYLNDLANKSGGKLHRADTLLSLPAAFAQIAAELRTQYSLGYYPTNAERDGKERRIQVRTTRKGVVVRARPSYKSS